MYKSQIIWGQKSTESCRIRKILLLDFYVYLDKNDEGKNESGFHFVAVDLILINLHYTDTQPTLTFSATDRKYCQGKDKALFKVIKG